uniref:Uncharacterized protein n=1 Tax=Glossina brevipalpis TaxID=37001 RepID=A0A1A9X4R9_9MUSC
MIQIVFTAIAKSLSNEDIPWKVPKMLKLIVFSRMAILLFTLCFTIINGNSMESDDQFTDSTTDQNQATAGALTMHKRPSFFVGSRYGRSGSSSQLLSSLKTRRLSVVPRNDRFFLSSRYGKRATTNLDATRNDFMTPFTAYERALLSEVSTGSRLNDKYKVNDNNSLPPSASASATSLLSTSAPATVMSCIYTGLENYYRCNSM